jgi:Bifunctional DNA primase/polymerase, N-terminal
MTARVDAALGYAAMGIHVFPCNDLKEPYTKHGFHDASLDETVIRSWWDRWPNAQIGVDCGRSKLAIVDLDVKDGKDGPGEWKKLT